MKKLILAFGLAFAAAGALWTLFSVATPQYGRWNPQGDIARGLAILVIGPAWIVGRAISFGHSGNTWQWVSLALLVNAPLHFGIGALTGALAWRLRKSPLITRIFVAAAIPVSVLALVSKIPDHLASPSRSSCINNLRQIEGAKEQWALEQHKLTNDTPTWEDVLAYLRSHPECPDGGTYRIGRVDEPPSCSIPRHDSIYRDANKRLE